jgi:anti-anti-sigma regulatory factor
MIEEALQTLAGAEGEMFLDLSSMGRLNTADLGLLRQLAAEAKEKSVTVTLRGVNVDVYKTLKLVKLAERFAFAG